VPLIGKTGISYSYLAPEMREMIGNFRIRYLEEVSEKRIQELIERLEGLD
jgi:hypothetical protein